MVKKKDAEEMSKKQCDWEVRYVYGNGNTKTTTIYNSSCNEEVANDDIINRLVLTSEGDSIVSMRRIKK